MSQFSQNIECVGLNFRMKGPERQLLCDAVKRQPLQLTLERVPGFEHDTNAIKVVCEMEPWSGKHLGYVGRETAAVLAPHLDDGSVVILGALLTQVYEPELKKGMMDVELERV